MLADVPALSLPIKLVDVRFHLYFKRKEIVL